MDSLRVCVDLDGVICELRKTPEESYASLAPVPGAREALQALKSAGHTIIIHTARRMLTHEANVGRVVADVGATTLKWLEQHGIPFDEIYFGKPYAHFYVDDNAVRFSDWEKLMLRLFSHAGDGDHQ